MARNLLLLWCAAALFGCPPVLNNDDDDATTGDDDDATTGDDDDTTWGDDDDDDTTWGDDDDIVDPGECEWAGEATSWVTGPDGTLGAWVNGDLTIDPALGALSLTTDSGELLSWRLNDDAEQLVGVDGWGGVYWWQPGLGAWGGDFVLAVESQGGARRDLIASVAGIDSVSVPGWDASFSLSRGPCEGFLQDDGCGVYQVAPMIAEVMSWDGSWTEIALYPGLGVASPELSVYQRHGQTYFEMWCEDADMLSWSFSMTQIMEVWDGVRPLR